jgi:hypothetical protein
MGSCCCCLLLPFLSGLARRTEILDGRPSRLASLFGEPRWIFSLLDYSSSWLGLMLFIGMVPSLRAINS